MSLADKIREVAVLTDERPEHPVWKGPFSDEDNGGITFSLLSRYLQCKERFRLMVIEGIRPSRDFNHRIEYGNMWHLCEENHAASQDWLNPLKNYSRDLARRFPLQQLEVEKWYNVCKVQFPEYVKFWQEHPDATSRIPLFQEQIFKVPYKLPSGRTVYLRGKFDSADVLGIGKNVGIYAQENKTKGDINETKIKRQLTFDFQTQLYLVALKGLREDLKSQLKQGLQRAAEGSASLELERGSYYTYDERVKDFLLETKLLPIRGVVYNVIRRPLSGGKGSIVQRKGSKNVPAETKQEYYARLTQYIKDEPESYFMRWKVDVYPSDVTKFEDHCLIPLLENLCDDYEWWAWCSYEGKRVGADKSILVNGRNRWNGEQRRVRFAKHCPRHYRHPFGVANSIDEYGYSDIDAHLDYGSMAGLERVDTLFSELKAP